MAGQQRGMEVEATVARQLENRSGEKSSVGGYDNDVGPEAGQFCLYFVAAESRRLEDGNAQLKSGLLDGWRFRISPSASRTVWRGIHRCYFHSRHGLQSPEHWDDACGRAHEDCSDQFRPSALPEFREMQELRKRMLTSEKMEG